MEAKEEVHRLRNDFDRDSRERRNEIQRLERRFIQREESLDKKSESLEKKEDALSIRDCTKFDQMEENIQAVIVKRREELKEFQL